MTAILTAFLPNLWPYIIGAAAIIAAWWGRYALGKRAGRQAERQQKALQAAEAATKAAERDKETLERMTNVPVLDADRSREWLHARDPATK